MKKQFFELGDRVVFDVTETAVADLPKQSRISEGTITEVRLRLPGTEFEHIIYVVRLDKQILSERTWSIRSTPGEKPEKLTLV